MRRWASLAAGCCLFASCSLVYDRDRYDPACTKTADCTSVDPLFVCDPDTSRCKTCDEDGDGFPNGDAECAELTTELTPDCDDGDPARAPGNAPLCGNTAQETCEEPSFNVLRMLSTDTIEESGHLGLRQAADPGGPIRAFDVGVYPPTDAYADPDAVVAYTTGSDGSRRARLLELDLDGEYRSREVDPAPIRSPDPDFRPLTDVEDVQLRTLLFPNADFTDVTPGLGLAMLGTDETGDARIGGGAVMHDDSGPAYSPFASLPRTPPAYANVALVQFGDMFLPAAVWREPGGRLVRATGVAFEGVDPLAAVTDPVIPEGPASLYGTFGRLVIGLGASDQLYFWDLTSATVGTGTLAPRTGRVAVGYSADSTSRSAIGDFIIAYPDGTDVVHQILSCATATEDGCVLSGPVRTPGRVAASLMDMDLFALALVTESDGVQTASLAILGGDSASVSVPMVTSDDVGGRIDDLHVSISFSDELGLHIALALLVTPDPGSDRQVLWVTGARLCGSQGRRMDGGMPDAGPPPGDAGTVADASAGGSG